jgi:zinc transport system substrate-binding protein
MIKKLLMLFTIPIMIVTLISCVSSAKYDVIATLYPQYDMARYISGDELSVKLILPYGTSPHDFEPTSNEMKMIEDASLILLTSYELEPWLIDLEHDNKENLEELIGTEYTDHDDHDGDNHDGDDHDDHDGDNHDGDDHDDHDGDEHDGDDHDDHDGDDHDGDDHDDHHHHDHADIHYWTRPDTMIAMVREVAEALAHISPENQELFMARKEEYIEKINSFSEELNEFLHYYEDTNIKLFIAGHNAMGEFAEYYGFEIVSLYPDFIPDAELTSRELSNFIDLIKENNILSLFLEPLFEVAPVAAETISSTLASEGYTLEFLELSQFHNISASEANENMTLFEIYRNNIENIKSVIKSNYGER